MRCSVVGLFTSDYSIVLAQWINPDGSKPHTIIGYDIRENQFVVTGDIDEWEREHPDLFASPVVSLLHISMGVAGTEHAHSCFSFSVLQYFFLDN